ncbi:tonB-system energizer ExbB [Phaeospirillum tilakii]|uniref:Biopolymer transport protein ExbB n=1 Tax=Phaeospirillum tilakii TaxID=741673 RepID=A0ABW5CFT2_9PROT
MTSPDLPPSSLPHDLSPWAMFMSADSIVQTVMVGLTLASVATWSLWLVKVVELALARRRVRQVKATLEETVSLNEAIARLGDVAGAEAHLARAAMAEARLSGEGSTAGLKERIASRLGRIEVSAGRQLAKGTGLLATIGAVAPFVGLFGTVWGIMNSFVGISRAQTTNLAVVAPGIAEALLATALGLVAAIPAVVIYNAFARSISGYKVEMADASAAVQRIVSRDLDRRALPLPKAAE